MKLKVCGARTMPMVQVCQDLSVPYIGFNFVPTSKRLVDLETAHTLSHAYTGTKVGVFQNQSMEEILQVAHIVDLDIIQLHGQEDAAYIETLKAKLSPLKPYRIWKAVSINSEFNKNSLQLYSKNCDLILFDGKSPGSGTQIEDQNELQSAVVAAQNLGLKFGIAGGIKTATVTENLALFPNASLFDTASGVETNGNFNKEKLEILLSQLVDV